jgi:hypothetical protein
MLTEMSLESRFPAVLLVAGGAGVHPGGVLLEYVVRRFAASSGRPVDVCTSEETVLYLPSPYERNVVVDVRRVVGILPGIVDVRPGLGREEVRIYEEVPVEGRCRLISRHAQGQGKYGKGADVLIMGSDGASKATPGTLAACLN